MTTPSKLNEFNHAEDPARLLLEHLRAPGCAGGGARR